MEDRARTTSAATGASRFELAPPRRFVLPAILLLLTEQPGYGYSLEKDLREFRFGHIDRPTVYRTLAQLEADGLVESWSEAPTAGQARRVYGVTPLGERVLRVWMSVIKEERDCLGRVLRRYQATGTVDAVLAEVEGGWAAALGFGWSPVATTSPAQRRLVPVDTDRGSVTSDADPDQRSGRPDGTDEAPTQDGNAQRFRLVPDRSVVLDRGALDGRPDQLRRARRRPAGSRRSWPTAPSAPAPNPPRDVEIAVDGLRSGNSVYDAELLRRISARRFPTRHARPPRLRGERLREPLPVRGRAHVPRRDATDRRHCERRGRRPTVGSSSPVSRSSTSVTSTSRRRPVLMLRIYPDVRVRLHVEADLET